MNGDNMDYVRREASRTFRTKKSVGYLKGKINELETDSKNTNIRDLYRGVNVFKKVYQARNNFVKDENDDLFADPHCAVTESVTALWFSEMKDRFIPHDYN
jgi:hypothetical protein